MTFCDLPVLIVNDRAQALAAFAAAAACGRAVQVETPADMAEVLGPAWMRAFLDSCAAEPPGPVVFHCGGSAGLAQAGLYLALPALRFDPEPGSPPRVAAALAEIAAAQGATLLLGPPPAPHWRFPPPVARPDPTALAAAAAAWLNGL
ncbi:MAG: hypothetical protein AB7D00_10685 [Rhodospirillaceae bacterium]